MKKPNFKKRISLFCATAAIICSTALFSGCSGISGCTGELSMLKDQTLGNNYTFFAYDHFGNQVLSASGKRINLSGDMDAEKPDSYLTITIDGHRWEHVGNTLVFVEDGCDILEDFNEPIETDSHNSQSTGWMPLDRKLNNFRNVMGDDYLVAVYSQLGVPICIFEGDDCYTKVPTNMGKAGEKITYLNIDGKSVWVYRANIDIIPKEILD